METNPDVKTLNNVGNDPASKLSSGVEMTPDAKTSNDVEIGPASKPSIDVENELVAATLTGKGIDPAAKTSNDLETEGVGSTSIDAEGNELPMAAAAPILDIDCEAEKTAAAILEDVVEADLQQAEWDGSACSNDVEIGCLAADDAPPPSFPAVDDSSPSFPWP